MALWKKKDEIGTSIAPHASSAVMPSRAPEPTSLSHLPAPPPKRFGIDQTIQLMRTLPRKKDPELVIAVMKATLESVEVHLPDIVQDAAHRLLEIETRVQALKAEIAGLERDVDLRLAEIVRLEAAHAETVEVKECIEQSEGAVPEIS